MRRLSCWLVALVGVCLLAGCSKGLGQVPVKGKVTFKDGSPAGNAMVIFSNAEKGISANAATKEDGTFTLGTEKPGDGAPVGTYKVMVMPGTDPKTGGASVSIDVKYQTAKNTPIQLEVKDEDNYFDIQVEKPTGKVPVH